MTAASIRQAGTTGEAFDRVVRELERRGHRVTRHGHYATTTCTHPGADNRSGLSIFDNGSRVRLTCFTRGCDSDEIAESLGLTWKDLYDRPAGDSLAVYRYDDGRTVHRKAGKKFHQTGTSGTPTLYRASKVKAAVARGETVYLVEGEEDVHSLEAVGCTATTAPMGARGFNKVDVSPLRGATVIAIPDNDEQGARWAELVEDKLHGVAEVRFARPAYGKDASDHLAAGKSIEEFKSDSDRLPDQSVLAELRKLRIHERARKLLAEERRGPADPFDAGSLSDVLSRPAPPASRVQDLIPWEAGTLLTAQRKTGKTTATLNLARSLLTGEDFLGRFGVREVAGEVALLNFEVSAQQLARWAHEVGVPPQRLFLVNLRGRRNPLGDAEDRARLAALLRSHSVETVICDPFGRAYTGASQNDAGEVGAFLADLDRFVRAEVGALDLLLTAHAGWNGERTRGSTALEDWADSIITLTRDDSAEGGGDRYLRAIGRDVDLDEDRLSFDPETRLLTLAGSGSRKAARDNRRHHDLDQDTLGLIAQRPGLNTSEIGRALREDGIGFQKGDEYSSVKRLFVQGRVRCEPGPRGSKRYFLATYPDVPQPTPPGDVLTYPDPTYIGGVGQEGTSRLDLPRSTCQSCRQPMTVVEPGQITHPGCAA